MTTSELRAERQLIGHLHAFRGITILAILAIHVNAFLMFFGADTARVGNGYFVAVEVLLHNATIFFAMISGLLFALLLEQRGWKRFFRAKAINVALPYAVMTLLYLIIAPTPEGMAKVALAPLAPAAWPHAFAVDFLHLAPQHNLLLWYLPVLLILFVMTPPLAWVLRSRAGGWALALMLLPPLVWSRVWPSFGWSNIAFFLAPYAAGIYFGAPGRYRATLDWFARHRWAVLGAALLVSVPGAFLYEGEGAWTTVAGINLFESLTYVQKMLLAPLLLVWLQRFDAGVPAWLSRVADDSFAIYFLHAWAIMGWLWLVALVAGPIDSAGGLALAHLAGTGAVLAVLVLSIAILRRLLGRWSRPLIGA